jgi:hypothetical protein
LYIELPDAVEHTWTQYAAAPFPSFDMTLILSMEVYLLRKYNRHFPTQAVPR